MIGHFETLDNAARDYSAHPLTQAADILAAVGATSSVFWWQFLSSGGQIALLALGIIAGVFRIALMVREWRKGK